MKVAETRRALASVLAAERAPGRRVGLVPTMGALHEGHGRLIDTARRECGVVVVSIFVNPIQFGPGEDFERYPRPVEADLAFCRARGVDVVFRPPVEEMYPEPPLAFVDVEGVTETLCGASRPGHFRGVATVVTKLFHLVQPDRAYFGQKDGQQVVVVRRLVFDLNFPVEIRVVETVREEDGLALSSRNAYLSPAERQAAPVLYRALRAGEALIRAGERDAAKVRDRMRAVVDAEPQARIDYLTVVDGHTLQEVRCAQGSLLLAGAVWIGKTRLIDNLPLEVDARAQNAV